MNPPNDQKSLRDEFAMAALTGLIALPAVWSAAMKDIAEGRAKTITESFSAQCYELADAMLTQRSK